MITCCSAAKLHSGSSNRLGIDACDSLCVKRSGHDRYQVRTRAADIFDG